MNLRDERWLRGSSSCRSGRRRAWRRAGGNSLSEQWISDRESDQREQNLHAKSVLIIDAAGRYANETAMG